jgi:hypothetical protein
VTIKSTCPHGAFSLRGTPCILCAQVRQSGSPRLPTGDILGVPSLLISRGRLTNSTVPCGWFLTRYPGTIPREQGRLMDFGKDALTACLLTDTSSGSILPRLHDPPEIVEGGSAVKAILPLRVFVLRGRDSLPSLTRNPNPLIRVRPRALRASSSVSLRPPRPLRCNSQASPSSCPSCPSW